MKLAAVIIVFNPNIESLLSNIKNIAEDVETIVLYQNSILNKEVIESNFFMNNVVIIGDGLNVGIGKALNRAVEFLKGKNFSHILTLDQDSYFAKGHLNQFLGLISKYEEKNVGIFAPNFNNRGKLHFVNGIEPFEDSDAITSGSIFPLDIFDLVGGFNDNLFIDTVDQEFCYRLKSNFGLKTVIFPSIHLIHELGYPTKIIFGLTTNNYSSFRTYYLVRNHIMIWKKYPKLYKKEYKINLIRNYILVRFIKVIIGEKQKRMKIKSICKGIYDGLKGELLSV